MTELYRTTAEIFRKTDGRLRRCIEKELKSLDEEVYRSQHRLLMMLGKNPNCSQNELASALGISPAAVAVSLGKLEKGGYIRRETNLDDHRSNQVAITEKGNQIICKSIKIFDKVECAMFDGFTKEELENFHELMKKAYGNLDKMLQNKGGAQ
ncbi:MAG: MarR family transcriptional regulator [Clostridium sp.]|nr:MarR family transcriptional regulator [Clostridium sp.]